ncbi:DUF4269 domain-containing protein [Sphingobacterium tabacisoli]|uniref:DUF4269 domain-containing protein n=1 Tax=Sphingobacterium tabacisoli TaxID=2044855 RepID=A0ABW5LAC5_9SPHI|nr:DUF4269 domain-containing protein [Sphingobacterium tabacisoli]
MNIDFKDTAYLKEGNKKQKQAYRIITEHQILDVVKDYDPIVVGTIPIDIDIEGSDIDIILQATELDALRELLTKHFSKYQTFQIIFSGDEILTCSFETEGTAIELFAKDEITTNQNGYRHMIKEYEILQSKGPDFAQKIRDLKRKGIKTEPAFCKMLDIKGDPYIELLNYQVR